MPELKSTARTTANASRGPAPVFYLDDPPHGRGAVAGPERHERSVGGDAERPLASRRARLAAAVLDLAIFYGPISPAVLMIWALAIAMFWGGFDPGAHFRQINVAILAAGAVGTITLPIAWLYELRQLRLTGQTVGQTKLKIRVIPDSGGPPRSPILFWLRLLFMPHFLAFFHVVALPILVLDTLFIFRADRKCLHDHIAKTRVVVE